MDLTNPETQTLINVGTQLVGTYVPNLMNFAFKKLQNFINELISETDMKIEEILDTSSGQESVRIAMNYIKENNGVPNNEVFKVLKAVLVKHWKASQEGTIKADLGLEYARIISTLDPNELLLLIATFRQTKKEDYKYEQNVISWTGQMEKETGLIYPELIDLARETLIEKKLIHEVYPNTDRHKHLFSVTSTDRNNLTGLGYSIIQYIYSDLEDDLSKLGKS